MAITGLDAKTIDQLQEAGKLNGLEKTIISDGTTTRKVSIDTIVGYTANRLAKEPTNTSINPSIGSTLKEQCIFFVPEGNTVPVVERAPGSFYLEETRQTSIRTQISLPTSVSVSKSLGLRRV